MPPERKHFAAGDYITHFPAGNPHEILIDSPWEKQGWKSRSPATITTAMFPGTAIQIDGKYFEIVHSARIPGDKPRYHYYLNAWPDHSPIRLQFAYTREECERTATAARKEKEESLARTVLTVLSPIVGLLPAQDQRDLENNYGIDALRCTFLSNVLTLIAGVGAALLAFVGSVDPGALRSLPVIGNFSPLAVGLGGLVLALESILRFLTLRHDEPIGSFVIALPLEIVRAIVQRFDPNYRRRRFQKMESGSASVFLNARDDVIRIDATDLQIESLLPKPNWTAMTGISFDGVWYGCVDSSTTAENKHRYTLRQAPPGTVFRTTCFYTREEVRDRFLEKRRQDLGTWVDTFSPFWGLLNGLEQKQLEKIYGFKPLKYTAWTIVILLIVGCVNVAVSLMNMAAGISTGSDLWWLLGSGYLVLENSLRLQQWFRNEPSGSVLGVLLRPFAAKLLRVS